MQHGGNKTAAARAYGVEPSEMIDLSTGISPRPYPLDLGAFELSDLIELPQAEDAEHLTQVMTSSWHIPDSAKLALASGSGAIISLMPHLYQGDKRHVYCPEPVYSEHVIAWQNAGYTIITYDAGAIPDVDWGRAAAILAVQPGNPMGHIAPPSDWLALMSDAAAHNVMVIFDEAFIDLAPQLSLIPHMGQKGQIVIRSFGKFYGLAGVRLGAAIGHPDDITALYHLMGPWAVSTMALRFGAAAIADHAWADDQRRWLSDRMTFLKEGLAARNVTIVGGTDLYLLIDVADAARLQDDLARQGFWTRIFDSNPRWMRLGLAHDDAIMARFLTAWDHASGH